MRESVGPMIQVNTDLNTRATIADNRLIRVAKKYITVVMRGACRGDHLLSWGIFRNEKK